MIIGALRVTLHLPDSHSLKDKRQIVKSLLARTRQDFGVASAETGGNDRWQIAELGFAAVSASETHVTEVLQNVARYIAETRPDLDILDQTLETFSLDEGS
jgi:uncharacterized protein YlxP (DUF503 family)